MKNLVRYIYLGLGHGLNDFISALVILMCTIHYTDEIGYAIAAIVGYNLLAFGGQFVLAKFLPEKIFVKPFLLTCFALLLAAVFTYGTYPLLSVFLAGLSSAIYHVIGGVESVRDDNKSFGLGIFLAPGVVGLALGWHFGRLYEMGMILALSIIALALICFIFYPNRHTLTGHRKLEVEVEQHDALMVVFLLLFSVRSFIWNYLNQPYLTPTQILVLIALSAFAGKIIGGFLADRIGHFSYTIAALSIAIIAMFFVKIQFATLPSLWSVFIVAFLIQSTIAPTISMFLKAFKGGIATGISLALGLTIVLGLLPYLTVEGSNPPIYLLIGAILLVVSMFLLYKWYRKRELSKE